MIIDGPTVLDAACRLTLALLIVSMAVAFARMVRGPRAADRVVALDLITMLVLAFLTAFAVQSGDTSFLDVAIAFALVAFLGTVALARFLMRSAKQRRPAQRPEEKP